jgi:hypothetical protein
MEICCESLHVNPHYRRPTHSEIQCNIRDFVKEFEIPKNNDDRLNPDCTPASDTRRLKRSRSVNKFYEIGKVR